MFCSKCGSLMVPKKQGKKKVLTCSCGNATKETDSAVVTEQLNNEQEVEEGVVLEDDLETLPLSKEEKCPKCGHKGAYYWFRQTRAADEAETKFLRCEECKHTWREYD